VTQYEKGSARYIQLVVQYPDRPGSWHTNGIRSYGLVGADAEAQAQSDQKELQQYASDSSAPVPVGMVDEVVWRNFQRLSQSGPPSIFDPNGVAEALRGAASDLAHFVGWAISDAVGDPVTKVNISQPDMSDADKRRFIQWLGGFPPDAQRRLLAYRWRFLP
jgi:hypothetical protein